MNLKRWTVALAAALALAACGREAQTPAGQTPAAESTTGPGAAQSTTGPIAGDGSAGDAVARLNDVVLTRQELDQRVARIQEGAKKVPTAMPGQPEPPTPQVPSALEVETTLVSQFIDQTLILSLARQKGITVEDKEIDALIDQFRQTIPQQTGGTLDDAIQNQLGLPGSESSEFRLFTSFIVAQQKLANSLVTTDTVRMELTEEVRSQTQEKIDQVHSAHILVETEEQAKEVLARLDKGEKFEDLAKELSKDPGSGANGGDLGFVSRGQFVPEFEKAIFDELKPGETTKTAVKSQFGYHIIKVIERAERPKMTEEEANQQIEQRLPQQLQMRRQEELQKLVDGEREKAKSEGRLVQPTYPTPTPLPMPTEAPAAPTTQATAQP